MYSIAAVYTVQFVRREQTFVIRLLMFRRVFRHEFTTYASSALDRLMRSIVQTSNALQANKWLAGARLIYDAVKSRRAALGRSTRPFNSWAGLDVDVQQIVAGQSSLEVAPTAL